MNHGYSVLALMGLVHSASAFWAIMVIIVNPFFITMQETLPLLSSKQHFARGQTCFDVSLFQFLWHQISFHLYHCLPLLVAPFTKWQSALLSAAGDLSRVSSCLAYSHYNRASLAARAFQSERRHSDSLPWYGKFLPQTAPPKPCN